MKTIQTLILLLAMQVAGAQSRVIINEYMPWPNESCGRTSEFVELLNFGPGPVNIGCYILTEGDFAITIPPNTWLQPGQFYVIAGQSYIAAGCANVDSATTVHLNWNACTNCTSGTIPTTGDGLFTDGGTASEQVVLLDPSLRVIDAVVRNTAALEPSANITTGGNCPSKTFDLDLMDVHYEGIGESAGRGNSFARTLDGDCMWVKDTRQSANASNTTSGETTSVTYTLTLTNGRSCNGTNGSVAVTPSSTAVFPLTYTLSFDADGDRAFTSADTYTFGKDSVAPYLEINNLVEGDYRLSVGSALGCNLKTFEFSILPCGSVLALQIVDFRHSGTTAQQEWFSFRLADAGKLQQAVLEQSIDGASFSPAAVLKPSASATADASFELSIPKSINRFFRLRLHTTDGKLLFSPHLSLGTAVVMDVPALWPNPTTTTLHVVIPGAASRVPVAYKIIAAGGQVLQQGTLPPGKADIPVHRLTKGIYQLSLHIPATVQTANLRFMKQ